jgi:predicted RNA-binding protein YlqC (UPF0109 family)
MQDLVEYIAKSLASKPDEVTVTEVAEDGMLIFRLQVADEDKGRLIGKEGRVAQAIRVLLRVASVKEGTRAVLQIL